MSDQDREKLLRASREAAAFQYEERAAGYQGGDVHYPDWCRDRAGQVRAGECDEDDLVIIEFMRATRESRTPVAIVQAAWDAIGSLPALEFTIAEADALFRAINRKGL